MDPQTPPPPSDLLTGRRVVVTGATSGIGQQVAIHAARAGADVAICGLEDDDAGRTIDAIESAGRHVFHRGFDVADLDAVRAFGRAAVEFLGGLDGLVNNAGTNFMFGVADTTKEQLDRCFAVDFYSAWALSQEMYPALRASGSAVVVNVASIHAQRTAPGAFPYNAAKAALVAMTKSQALEWGPDGIRAIAIAPALIWTPLAERHFAQFDDPAAEVARQTERYAVGRAGTPDEIAALVTYLLSGRTGFMTGNTIEVDGGVGVRF